ncbi:MAG: hypothetical protein ACPGRX_05250 [Bdellovibrionales bacterium]
MPQINCINFVREAEMSYKEQIAKHRSYSKSATVISALSAGAAGIIFVSCAGQSDGASWLGIVGTGLPVIFTVAAGIDAIREHSTANHLEVMQRLSERNGDSADLPQLGNDM